MKIAEFIKFLESLDQNLTVRVVSHKNNGGPYEQGGTASTEDFREDKHIEICGGQITIGEYDA